MLRARIDISRDMDGEPVVFAVLDLREDEIAAAAHAVAAIAAERYRTPRISTDEVLDLRELTALADELDAGSPSGRPSDATRDGTGPGAAPGGGGDPWAGSADPWAGSGDPWVGGTGGTSDAGGTSGAGGRAGSGEVPPGSGGGHAGTEGPPPAGGAAFHGAPAIEPGAGLRTMVFRPARLSMLREAVTAFVESRDEGDWIRQEDREPLAILRGMLLPLEQLCAEAMRAALSPESHTR